MLSLFIAGQFAAVIDSLNTTKWVIWRFAYPDDFVLFSSFDWGLAYRTADFIAPDG